MKKLLSLDPRVLKRLNKLEKGDRVECLVDLADTFGEPHRHGGIGIRKLGDRLFECRGNLDCVSFLKIELKISLSSSWAITRRSKSCSAVAASAEEPALPGTLELTASSSGRFPLRDSPADRHPGREGSWRTSSPRTISFPDAGGLCEAAHEVYALLQRKPAKEIVRRTGWKEKVWSRRWRPDTRPDGARRPDGRRAAAAIQTQVGLRTRRGLAGREGVLAWMENPVAMGKTGGSEADEWPPVLEKMGRGGPLWRFSGEQRGASSRKTIINAWNLRRGT